VDFTEDVVDVTNEVINHFAAETEEITNMLEEVTPEITPIIIAIGVASEPGGGGPVEGTEDPRGASARQLLEARKAVLEATALQANGLKAMAQSLRAQIAAMRRPKP
jgi:hypothetical protein